MFGKRLLSNIPSIPKHKLLMKVYTFKCLFHSLHRNCPHLYLWEEKPLGTQFPSSKISHYGEE